MANSTTHTTRTVLLDEQAATSLFGAGDEYLRQLESRYPEVEVFLLGRKLTLSGPREHVNEVEHIIDRMRRAHAEHGMIQPQEMHRLLHQTSQYSDQPVSATETLDAPLVIAKGKHIRPQTAGQRSYVNAVRNNTITFGIGPAGTGKTFLAMACAVQALQQRKISRIVLTRPAVEAGERLGYLPGTLEDKIDPYLRPLFDAIASLMEPETVSQLLAQGTIEVAPLAYMRGRTLNDAFIVLDEAQNTSPEQMKMFLTRLGFGSTMVVTGDVTQIDLPRGHSGLIEAVRVLDDVDDIAVCRLGSDDIVRHSLVSRIVDAYDRGGK